MVDFAKYFAPWLTLALGVVMGCLRSVWSFIYQLTSGYAITKISLSVTVEDMEHREAYVWLSYWVEKNLRNRKVNALLLRICEEDESADPANETGFDVKPEYGTYYLKHAGRLVTVEHEKERLTSAHHWRSAHSIRLRIWLSRNRVLILDILEEARASYQQSKSMRVDYYHCDTYTDWIGCTVPGRTITSLFHRTEMLEDLFAEVRTFHSSKRTYEN